MQRLLAQPKKKDNPSAHQVQVTKMASTISQNLPRTFRKLAEKWDKKVGSRNFESKCWTLATTDSRDPIQRVALLMSVELGKYSGTSVQRFNQLSVECVTTEVGQIWLYDMRQSGDSLPKSQDDAQRLYGVVRAVISRWFNVEDQFYLEKNIHIAVCFFVWYYTKPNFFYNDNVTRQTTRKGIQRVWTPLFVGKRPKLQSEPKLTPTSKNRFVNTTDALLPKQQQQQENLRKDIQALITSTTLVKAGLDWQDSHSLHGQISEILVNTDSGLSIKQNKKLQNKYNEYVTLSTKIKRSTDKIRKAKLANSKIVVSPKESVWVSELGSPPDSPPELVRATADQLGYVEDNVSVTPSECMGCSTCQPNQSAHMGGCLPDEFDDAEVPDSWEDL